MSAYGAPPRRRSVLRIARRALVVLAVTYVLAVAGAWAFQRSLIYRPQRFDGLPSHPTTAFEEYVVFPSGDGVRLGAIYLPPPNDRAPVALVTHGNAGNAMTWRPFLEPFRRLGCGTFLLDPRGYGWAEGTPSEEGWHRDAEAALAWLSARGIPPQRIIAVGVSIGSGLAVPIAAEHPVRALILESPFTSLVDAASDHYPFLPCGWILRDKYDNLSVVKWITCPVLILHGTSDTIVSPEHSRRLAAAFPKPPTLRFAEGADHNDLTAWPGYEGALRDFLKSLP